jgi:hypothetical protein
VSSFQVSPTLSDLISSYLTDPSQFPPEFKNWITAWVETFPPIIPLSQVSGYAVSTTLAIAQAPAIIASGTAETAVTWGSIRKDASAMWASGSPTKLTCKVAGSYQCSAFLDWGVSALGVRILWLRKSGTTHIAGDESGTPNLNGNPQSASALIDLAVGDYIEATAIQNSGSSITPASGFLSAVRVGP